MDVKVKCKCGKVTGTAHGVTPSSGIHLVCLCSDCQAFARYLGREEDLLDSHGGTEIYQIAPCRLKIETGQDQLRIMRLSPKGLFRWYTDCCQTPAGNTMASPKMPFVGIPIRFFDLSPSDPRFGEAFGPIREKCFGRQARGGKPADAVDKASLGMLARVSLFLLKGMALGWNQPSSYFRNGQPITEPRVISKEERTRLFA